ncbi:hypothetical protein [Winogradskyella sp.]|uniref:hypothetical protein n=1 Tax=Winogradskyella sp. TaxID=1883156 RepID=UPI00260BDD00|nr:hypothetical protein [uncultured Winogradskyella sp.]
MNKYFKYSTVLLAVALMFNCEQDNDSNLSNFIGFEQGDLNHTIDEGQSKTIDITVATSETSSSDRVFDVIVDGSSTFDSPYTVPSTVTVPAGSNLGTLSISATDDEDLAYNVKTLVLDFAPEAGINYGDALTINLAQTCFETLATLNLGFDDYAEECVWELYDLTGTPTIIETGGSGGEYDDLDGSTFSTNFCLSPGNYGIIVYDLYGDGGTSYTVTSNGEELASGDTPDQGSGYPVTTQSISTFTIN